MFPLFVAIPNNISPIANLFLSGEFEVDANKTKFHFRTIETQDKGCISFAKLKQLRTLGPTISLTIF